MSVHSELFFASGEKHRSIFPTHCQIKMRRQFWIFQSLCVVLIATSAYGGPLPESITLQFAYCYELDYFSNDASISLVEGSFLVDNICMDSQRLTFHFLSSAEGGTMPYFLAQKSGMTVIFLDSTTMGIKIGVQWLDRPTVTFLCQFQELAQALHVYNDIYRDRNLIRENFPIRLIQKLKLDQQTRSEIAGYSVLTLQAGLYTELYRNAHLIFTIKEESANGDARNPVLVFFASRCNISDPLVNNNVLLRFEGSSVLTMVLTFLHVSEANYFCETLRPHVNPTIEIPIPPAVLQILRETRVQ